MKLLKTFLKITFIAAIFLFVILTVLANVGGNSDALKQGVEQFASEQLHRPVQIGTFNEMQFFPDIRIDVADVTVSDSAENKDPVIELGSFVVSIGFFDVAFSTGRIKEMDIQGLKIMQGIYTESAIALDYLRIDDGALRFKGGYGNAPFEGALKLEAADESVDDGAAENGVNAEDAGDTKLYALKIAGDLDLKYDGYTLAGFLEHTGDGYDLKNFTLRDENGLVLKGDARYEDNTLGGSDIHLDLTDIIQGGQRIGAMKIPALYKDDKITADNITGVIGKTGPLKGSFVYDMAQNPAQMNIDLDAKEIRYEDFIPQIDGQSVVSGMGDISVKLSAVGDSGDQIKQNLGGEIQFVGGQGNFPTRALNVWGRGLVNTILPDLSADAKSAMNCAVIDTKIENGVAKTNALFLDTNRLTLTGSGDYDITKDYLKLTLQPEPKEISLGSVAAKVNVTGPIGAPSISPDMFDLGKKIGGIALGFVNPLAFAGTLTNLGLTENHPCREFLPEIKEEAQEQEQLSTQINE